MLEIYYILLLSLITYAIFASLGKPGIAVGLGFSMFPAEQLLQQGFGAFLSRGSLYNEICALAVSGSFVCQLIRQRGRIKATATWAVSLLLFSLATFSASWSPAGGQGYELIISAIPYIAIFGFAMPLMIINELTARQAVNTVAILGGFIILGHWITNYGARGVVIDVVRGRAVEANPLAVASFAGMVVICSIFTAFSSKRVLIRLCLTVVAFLALAVIVRSGSRGQLLTLMLSVVLGIPAASRGSLSAKSLQLAIAAALSVPIGYFLVSQFDFAARWGKDKVLDATFERWTMIEDALSAWISSGPFAFAFGSGVNASVKTLGNYCHNLPVDILYEEGVVGLVLFIAVIATSLGPKLITDSFRHLPKGERELICIFACLTFFEFSTLLKQGNLSGAYFLFALFIILSSLTRASRDLTSAPSDGVRVQ